MYNAIENYKSTYKTFAASTSINMLSIVAAEIVLKRPVLFIVMDIQYNCVSFPPGRDLPDTRRAR